jgi:hypothetical protein
MGLSVRSNTSSSVTSFSGQPSSGAPSLGVTNSGGPFLPPQSRGLNPDGTPNNSTERLAYVVGEQLNNVGQQLYKVGQRLSNAITWLSGRSKPVVPEPAEALPSPASRRILQRSCSTRSAALTPEQVLAFSDEVRAITEGNYWSTGCPDIVPSIAVRFDQIPEQPPYELYGESNDRALSETNKAAVRAFFVQLSTLFRINFLFGTRQQPCISVYQFDAPLEQLEGYGASPSSTASCLPLALNSLVVPSGLPDAPQVRHLAKLAGLSAGVSYPDGQSVGLESLGPCENRRTTTVMSQHPEVSCLPMRTLGVADAEFFHNVYGSRATAGPTNYFMSAASLSGSRPDGWNFTLGVGPGIVILHDPEGINTLTIEPGGARAWIDPEYARVDGMIVPMKKALITDISINGQGSVRADPALTTTVSVGKSSELEYLGGTHTYNLPVSSSAGPSTVFINNSNAGQLTINNFISARGDRLVYGHLEDPEVSQSDDAVIITLAEPHTTITLRGIVGVADIFQTGPSFHLPSLASVDSERLCGDLGFVPPEADPCYLDSVETPPDNSSASDDSSPLSSSPETPPSESNSSSFNDTDHSGSGSGGKSPLSPVAIGFVAAAGAAVIAVGGLLYKASKGDEKGSSHEAPTRRVTAAPVQDPVVDLEVEQGGLPGELENSRSRSPSASRLEDSQSSDGTV